MPKDRICLADDCSSAGYRRDLCRLHYERARRDPSMRPHWAAAETMPCIEDDCAELRHIKANRQVVQRCRTHEQMHKARLARGGDFVTTPEGHEVYTIQSGYESRCIPGEGTFVEHRYQMELLLGRKLLGQENVHHINGIRNDNRIENLELWFRAQPAGQRVGDLIAYVTTYHADAVRQALATEGRDDE